MTCDVPAAMPSFAAAPVEPVLDAMGVSAGTIAFALTFAVGCEDASAAVPFAAPSFPIRLCCFASFFSFFDFFFAAADSLVL